MRQNMRLIIIRIENSYHSQNNKGKEKENNEKNNITSGIPILVSGNYYLIENIIDEYNTIELLGHSLGGLTALIISSI